MTGNINMIIGSWGSYNACNSRALGSKWLDLSEYSDWEEIEEELKKQGFELDGIDEELFIQDIEGISSDACNWDYKNPQTFFETLLESGVLTDDYKYKIMEAFLEVRDLKDFEELVEKYGDCWDDDINLYEGMDWEDYGREMYASSHTIDDILDNFFDFERYGEYIGSDSMEKYSGGLIEIVG